MTNPQLIQRAWIGYAEQVLPQDAPEIQYIECRKAFFAGARSLLTVVFEYASPGEEVTMEDEKMMGAIESELDEFIEDMECGNA